MRAYRLDFLPMLGCFKVFLRWATDLQKQLASRQVAFLFFEMVSSQVDKEAADAELKRKEEAIQVRTEKEKKSERKGFQMTCQAWISWIF